MARIPKILHYCFGLSEDFGGKPWSLIHHVCLKSAITHIRPDAAYLYYEYEPTGPWWELSRALVTPVKIDAPRSIFDRPVDHPAHRADVVRLEKLIETGGIYLDADVLVHRSFDDLLDHSSVLGQEGVSGEKGMANAVILAEPGAPFLRRWYEEYRSFRGSVNEYWNEHSVELPKRLAAEHPEEITVLPYNAFFWPLWTPDHMKWIFASNEPIVPEPLYANHLWESLAWKFVKDLTPGEVRRVDTNFHRWARPLLEGVPDNCGATGNGSAILRVAARAKGNLKRIAKRILGRGPKPLPAQGSFEPTRAERQKAFQRVYSDNLWGVEKASPFFSGVGSRGEAADFYVENMAALLAGHRAELGRPLRIVDLGCGDFEVGRALLEKLPDATYVGCDIVPELIAHHQKTNASDRARFQQVDIVSDPLPEGDVCLVRQVLQHLPNADIVAVLGKLSYPYVYATEGQPMTRTGPVNPDKGVGHEVRFDWRTGQGRGVELGEAPFGARVTEVFRANVSATEIVVTQRVEAG